MGIDYEIGAYNLLFRLVNRTEILYFIIFLLFVCTRIIVKNGSKMFDQSL